MPETYKDGGGEFFCGLLPSDKAVMMSAPQFKDTYEVIPESEWPKSGGGMDIFMPFRWNQGNQGSCGGHGAVAAFTANWNYQFQENKNLFEFSPTFVYGMVNGGVDNGSRPDDLMKELQNSGVCLRSTVGPGEIYKSRYPAAAFEEAKRFRADKQVVINTFEELATGVLKNHGIYSGIFCGNKFTPDSNGLLPDWDGRKVGGHCVVPDSMISGPVMRKASDVEVGSEVYGHDGKVHPVTKVFRRYYNGCTVRIAKSNGLNIEVTEEHPVLVFRWIRKENPVVVGSVHGDVGLEDFVHNDKRYKSAWVKAKDVRPGDFIATPQLKLEDRKNKVQSPLPVNEDVAWLIGQYVGDGNICGYRDGSPRGIEFSSNKKDASRIKKILDTIGYDATITPRWKNGKYAGKGKPTSYRVRSCSPILGTIFQEFGVRASEKRFPEWVFSGEWDLQKVLSGYTSADGTIRNKGGKKTYTVTTTSRILAQQIRLIGITLGKRMSFNWKSREREACYSNAKPCWVIQWSRTEKAHLKIHEGMAMAAVQSVVFIPYTGTVYNFEVEGSNSFLVDTISTHNCTAQIGKLEYKKGRGWGVWTLNSWFPWGLNGWCWMPRSYFDGGLPDFQAVAIVSLRPDPQDSTPTPTPVVS